MNASIEPVDGKRVGFLVISMALWTNYHPTSPTVKQAQLRMWVAKDEVCVYYRALYKVHCNTVHCKTVHLHIQCTPLLISAVSNGTLTLNTWWK